MKKLAIIGASYLQDPLIRKAKEMGIETHVFAWKAGDVGEKTANFFYPISIVEKEMILGKCSEIGIDGICSIASDLAMPTVNYVASNLNLIGNSLSCTERSTDKFEMYKCFSENRDLVPKTILVTDDSDVQNLWPDFPVIVKPADRSGSRGVSLVTSRAELPTAIENAYVSSFNKRVLLSEFIHGTEYSVESVSWQGRHTVLAVTYKFTTGAPYFIESAHLQPAPISGGLRKKIEKLTCHALDSLGIEYGASHAEMKIDEHGQIGLIEIGGRMGGDHIGSTLVRLSTGIDFLKAVIDISLGTMPDLKPGLKTGYAAVRYFFSKEDTYIYEKAAADPSVTIEEAVLPSDFEQAVTDSSNRHGYFIFTADSFEHICPYLPEKPSRTDC